jgi:hypothetical protein
MPKRAKANSHNYFKLGIVGEGWRAYIREAQP